MTDDRGVPPDQEPPGEAPEDEVSTGPSAVMIGAAAVVAVAVVVLVVIFALRGGDDDVDTVTTATTTVVTDDTAVTTDDTTTTVADATTTTSDDTTTTDSATTTTDTATTTTEATTTTVGTTTTTDPGDTATTLPGDPTESELSVTVWPWVGSDVRYGDPVEAATAFAEEYLGMTDPIVGEFMQGDALSGEIEIRSIETFTPTLVSLRMFGEAETWWVLGAATADIEVDEPPADAVVSSPLVVSGRSVAFEGTVQVAIRVDGDDEPAFEGFVTGGGAPGDLAPFEEAFEWDAPDSGRGQIVFFTASSDDGRVLQATVVRVTFGTDE